MTILQVRKYQFIQEEEGTADRRKMPIFCLEWKQTAFVLRFFP